VRSGTYLRIDFVQLGLGVHHLDILSGCVPSILLTREPCMESGYSAFTISSRHRLRTHLNSLWLDRITCSAESPVPTLTEFLKLGSTGGLVTP
jgi:hypothetical protein